MEPYRPRVLVIDDLPDAADSFATLLAIWGYDAEPLYDGMSALASARDRPPAAVLVDIGMPRLDGFGFAELFRKLPDCGNCLIIAVTGHTGQVYRNRAMEVGIDHYLLKPVDLALLKNLLPNRCPPSPAPNASAGAVTSAAHAVSPPGRGREMWSADVARPGAATYDMDREVAE